MADFGIAKALEESRNSGQYSTRAVGTGPFMAPEQIDTPHKVDHHVDIYALGIVAYQMLAGELPFKQDSTSFTRLAQEIQKTPPPPLTSFGLHFEIERVVFKALAKAPDDRYESASAFANALDEAVNTWQKETGEHENQTYYGGMAVQAMTEQKWDAAAKHWRQFMAYRPDSDWAKTQLKIAEKEIRLDQLRSSANQSEKREDWDGVIAALKELLDISTDDEPAKKQLVNAQTQKELSILYVQVNDRLKKGELDQAIENIAKILERAPDYRDIIRLQQDALTKKVGGLKQEALFAIGRNDANEASRLVTKIKSVDPDHIYCSEKELDEISQLVEQKRKQKQRNWMAVSGSVMLLLCFVIVAIVYSLREDAGDEDEQLTLTVPMQVQVTDEPDDQDLVIPTLTLSPTPKATNTPLPTFTASPTPTQVATHTPTLTAEPTNTSTPTLFTPTPIASPTVVATPGVVASNYASVFAGPDATFAELAHLSPGEEATLLARDDRGHWWYVETKDGVKGWVWWELVTVTGDINLVPTLTPSPLGIGGTVPPPTIQARATLAIAEHWPIGNATCTGGQFEVDYWVQPSGGTGLYTYIVDDVAVKQNVAGGQTLRLSSSSGTILKNVTVRSGGQEITFPAFANSADYCSE